jgi:hypothetical protein
MSASAEPDQSPEASQSTAGARTDVAPAHGARRYFRATHLQVRIWIVPREDPVVSLLREDVYDRRWARHRDQLLTLVGIAAPLGGLMFSVPSLAALALLPVGPRAVAWLIRAN